MDIENCIDLTDTFSGLCLHWILISFGWFFFCFFFSRRGSNDGIAGLCTFYAKNVFTIAKIVHIYVRDSIVLFYMSYMTVTKGKSQTRYNFL